MKLSDTGDDLSLQTRGVSEGHGKRTPRPRVGLVLLNAARWLIRLPGRALILLVRGYQVTLSPLLGNRCRFHPSCSQYFIEAVRKYGAIRGTAKGLWRLARCHPFSAGGYDPP
jgi:putative membrane protein insertion efficiency factor